MGRKEDFSYTDDSGINDFLKPRPKRKRLDIKKPYRVLPALPPWNPKTHKPIGKRLFDSLVKLENKADNIPMTTKDRGLVDDVRKAFQPLMKIFKR